MLPPLCTSFTRPRPQCQSRRKLASFLCPSTTDPINTRTAMKLPLTLALDAHGLPRVFSDPAAAMAALASQPDVPSELFLVELQGQLEVQLQLEDDADPSTGSLHAGHKIGKLDMSVPVSPGIDIVRILTCTTLTDGVSPADTSRPAHRPPQARRPDRQAQHSPGYSQAQSPSENAHSVVGLPGLFPAAPAQPNYDSRYPRTTRQRRRSCIIASQARPVCLSRPRRKQAQHAPRAWPR